MVGDAFSRLFLPGFLLARSLSRVLLFGEKPRKKSVHDVLLGRHYPSRSEVSSRGKIPRFASTEHPILGPGLMLMRYIDGDRPGFDKFSSVARELL